MYPYGEELREVVSNSKAISSDLIEKSTVIGYEIIKSELKEKVAEASCPSRLV